MRKKVMIFLMIMLLVSIRTVKAMDCDPLEDTPAQGNANYINRTLTCDSEKTKTTKFEYPLGGLSEEVFRNKLCVVACKESTVFSFPSTRRVYAGMSFGYPLNVSSERGCRGTYFDTYQDFDKTYRTLIDMYMVLDGNRINGVPKADIDKDGYYDIDDIRYVENQASKFLDIDGNKVLDLDGNGVLDNNAIASLLRSIYNARTQKNQCDGWGTDVNLSSIYSISPTVSLRLKTSTNDVIENYEYKETAPTSRLVTYDDTTYASCTLVETMVGANRENRELSCENKKAIVGWNQLSRVTGRYTMKEKKVILYDGKVMPNDENTTEKTCYAGEKYYTPLTEKTKPELDNAADTGYGMTLTVLGVGNNINSAVPKNYNLTVNCFYEVRNLLSPQEGDYYYDKFSGQFPIGSKNPILYLYRTIDLKSPFPGVGRVPGANWDGEVTETINGQEVKRSLVEKYITSTAETIKTKSPYLINLTNDKINTIKRYNNNEKNSYTKFNLSDFEKSDFVENYYTIVETKNGETSPNSKTIYIKDRTVKQ